MFELKSGTAMAAPAAPMPPPLWLHWTKTEEQKTGEAWEKGKWHAYALNLDCILISLIHLAESIKKL